MFKTNPQDCMCCRLPTQASVSATTPCLPSLLLFLQAKFGFDSTVSGQIYAGFLALVYFLCRSSADGSPTAGASKCVVTGIAVMFIGYMVMAIPTEIRSTASLVILCAALLLIAVGTGLFKGNLQVMVGDLYNNARFSGQRDAAFSLFYMAINIGSMFAPDGSDSNVQHGYESPGSDLCKHTPAMCNLYLDGP